MPTIDLALLAVIAVSALFGLLRGFVGALASMAAWLLAGWVAFRHGAEAAFWLSDAGSPTPVDLFGGYALSFIAVLLVVGVVGWAVRLLVKGIGLSGLDRLLGLALGLARGLFVACAAVLLMGFTELPREPAWRQSQVVPALLPGAQWLRGWLPGWVAEQIDFGNGAAPGDNDRHPSLPLPVPLDEGVPQLPAPQPVSG